MKKNIYILFFLPLISLGQTENPWVYENGDNKRETYWNFYNKIKSDVKVIHYYKGIKDVEVSFKGFNYKTYNSRHSDGVIRKTTSKEPIRDGFSKEWNDKGQPCSEEFYIYGKCIYKGESCNNSWINPIGYSNEDNYNSSREFDLEFMINLFLDDIINNNNEKGEPNILIKNLRLNRKSPINGIKIKAIFTTLDKGVLAQSFGFKDDKNIILKVDPDNWLKATSVKRWYTLYHELGHDVLNFEHGQGGKMMFNYSNTEYSWDEFNEDRNYMFEIFLNRRNK